MHSRMLFSFFDADIVRVVADPIVMFTIRAMKQMSSDYASLPPLPNCWVHKQLHEQSLKSRRSYLKNHSKNNYNKKLNGCRVRR